MKGFRLRRVLVVPLAVALLTTVAWAAQIAGSGGRSSSGSTGPKIVVHKDSSGTFWMAQQPSTIAGNTYLVYDSVADEYIIRDADSGTICGEISFGATTPQTYTLYNSVGTVIGSGTLKT